MASTAGICYATLNGRGAAATNGDGKRLGTRSTAPLSCATVTCVASLQLIALDLVAPLATLLNHSGLYSKHHIYLHLLGGQSVLGNQFVLHRLHRSVAFAGQLQWPEVALLMALLLALPAVPQPVCTVR
jgi:hypothetical protein